MGIGKRPISHQERKGGGRFPRVLIVGTPMSQVSGGPITISNLFHDWPCEKVAAVYRGIYRNDPARKGRDFVLSRELSIPGIKRGIEWKTREEVMTNGVNSKCLRDDCTKRVPLHRTSARFLLERLGIVPLMQRYPLTKELGEFVSSFRPDIIYTHLGDIAISSLVVELSTVFRLPIAVHIMDDYPSTIYRTGLLSAVVRDVMDRQLRDIFARSAVRLGICGAMCEEYSQRYGFTFLPFHNPVDLTIWANAFGEVAAREKDTQTFNIVYSGRIGIASRTSIMDVCDLLRRWDEPCVSVAFNVFVNDLSKALETDSFLNNLPMNVRVQESPRDPVEIARILALADILLVPIDFDKESFDYIRLSMPTKVPAYMATGRPILVYGPPDVASVRYAREFGWALVVDKRSPDALKDAIVQLCHDRGLRCRLSSTAKNLAAQNHEASRIREKFRSAIAEAAERR